MLWLKLSIVLLAVVSQFYIINFQSSREGQDERGKEIQNKTNNFLFGILYLGILILIILHLFEVIPTTTFPNVLLYVFVSLSIFGALYSFIIRRLLQ